MTYRHALLLYRTVTPLHVGCGQDVGVVDLPIIRERTTGYPFVPGSGIRGSWRDRFKRLDDTLAEDERLTELLFGPEAKAGEEVRHAGCVAVHDARLLLFPVRSDRQVFLWLTCPAVLRRFAREVDVFVPGSTDLLPALCGRPGEEELIGPQALGDEVHLEEFLYRRAAPQGDDDKAPELLAAWAGKVGAAACLDEAAERTVLVSDASFAYFVQFATVVEQHNRLTTAKTVEGGALFSLESLPPETLLYGFVGGTDSREPRDDGAAPRLDAAASLGRLGQSVRGEAEPSLGTVHLGGHESTGQGVTRITWPGGEA